MLSCVGGGGRLRLGHNYAMQSHLLGGEPPPLCPWCQGIFTVVHVLINYSGLQSIRQQFFAADTLFFLSRADQSAAFFFNLKNKAFPSDVRFFCFVRFWFNFFVVCFLLCFTDFF